MARTHCHTSPRPDEFGHIGQAWNEVGWRVDIDFQKFTEPILPTRHMQAIAPTLPERYSPIRPNGYGNQGVYLAQIPRADGTGHRATGVAGTAWESSKVSGLPKRRKHRCRSCAGSWNGKSANVRKFPKVANCPKLKNRRSSKPGAVKACSVKMSRRIGTLLPRHARGPAGAFDCQPHQTVAGIRQPRAVVRRQRIAAHADD